MTAEVGDVERFDGSWLGERRDAERKEEQHQDWHNLRKRVDLGWSSRFRNRERSSPYLYQARAARERDVASRKTGEATKSVGRLRVIRRTNIPHRLEHRQWKRRWRKPTSCPS